MAATYTINQTVRLSATFVASGLNYDPTTVTFFVKSPKGVVTSYVYGTDSAVQKDGTGVYHLDVTPSAAGGWSYRVESASSTNGNSASEATFLAAASSFYS